LIGFTLRGRGGKGNVKRKSMYLKKKAHMGGFPCKTFEEVKGTLVNSCKEESARSYKYGEGSFQEDSKKERHGKGNLRGISSREKRNGEGLSAIEKKGGKKGNFWEKLLLARRRSKIKVL